MKEWSNAQIEELKLKCTQTGPTITDYPDDQVYNEKGDLYTSFSSVK
jgi:hypothetical protein